MKIFSQQTKKHSWVLSDEYGTYSRNQILQYDKITPITNELTHLTPGQLICVSDVSNTMHFIQILLWACEKKLILSLLGPRNTLFEKQKVCGELRPSTLVNLQNAEVEHFNNPHPTNFPEWGIIFQTSGTTGTSKYIFMGESNLLQNSKVSSECQLINTDSLCYGHLNLSHSGALTMQVLPTLLEGGQVILDQNFQPTRLIGVINKYQPSHFIIPPSHYRFLKKKKKLQQIDMSHAPWVISGSEPIPASFFQDIKSLGGNPLGVYGLTEAGPFLCTTQDSPFPESSKYLLGIPVADNQICLDSKGQYIVRGPSINPCLKIDNKGLSIASETLKQVSTGDYGFQEGKNLYFTHRHHDLINCGGYKFSIQEVESAILDHPNIEECRVFAESDPIRNQIPHAVVVLTDPTKGLQDLRKHLTQHLGSLKIPRTIKTVNSLDKTIIGKVSRNQ